MAEQTTSSPLFEKSADDIASRLEHDRSEAAVEMCREARQLAETFRGWGAKRPLDDVRIATIQQLFDLNRRAMDYLSRSTSVPPASVPGSRR